ncbi:MAG: hypothetical protein KAG96_00490 [Ichthyobacteriaceae bacterium]|nr:hypothetical protein [Ichthyobacteriaceae bacterium]
MNKFKLITIVTALGLFAIFSSCNDDEVDYIVTQTDLKTQATETALVDVILADVELQGESAFERNDNTFILEKKEDNPSVNVKINTVEKYMIIDFGSGIEGIKGFVRKGKIIVNYTGGFWNEGDSVKYSFKDYYIDDNKVEGNKEFIRLKPVLIEGVSKPKTKVTVDIKIVKADESGVVTRKSDRVRVWEEGSATRKIWVDDKFSLTGTSWGKYSNGKDYTITITEPLLVSMDCPNSIVGGEVEVKNNKWTQVVNFGDGTCDNFYEITKGDVSFPMVW